MEVWVAEKFISKSLLVKFEIFVIAICEGYSLRDSCLLEVNGNR